MCGIVGYIHDGKSNLDDVKGGFLRDALILDTFRGMDSTGLVTVCDNWDITTLKDTVEGWDFVRGAEYQGMPIGWAAIGHNRAATKGKVNYDNAHPFIGENVVLVHNGTLNDMGRSLPEFCNSRDVDSLNIMHALDATDPDKAVDVLKKINGAYTLVWTDDRDKSINMTRNSQRPLHLAYSPTKDIMWFMSDHKHLRVIKGRRYMTKMDAIYSMGTHQLLKFKQGSTIPEVTKYEPEPLWSGGAYYSTGKHWGNSAQRYYSGSFKSSTQWSSTRRKIFVNGSHIDKPKALTTVLGDNYGLDSDEDFYFQPDQFIPYPNRPEHGKFGMVKGEVWLEDWQVWWPMTIMGVSDAHRGKMSEKAWTVHLVGCTEQTDKLEPELLGEVIVFSWYRKEPDTSHSVTLQEPEPLTQDGAWICGPDQTFMNYQEWLARTHNGCAQCLGELDLSDHDLIWWIDNEPICPVCAEDIEQGEEDDTNTIIPWC